MLSCKELTELVTEYLEGRLSFADRLRFQLHLGMCRHCRAYLRQMKTTVRALGHLPAAEIPLEIREELGRRFRTWKEGAATMPWIKTVRAADAQGDLAEIYRAITSARGGIADVHRVQSLNPRALRAHVELYKAVVFQSSTLSRVARERIAVVVSAANTCGYCVAHHGEALRQLGDAPDVIDALGRGELPPALPEADRALLHWARQAALFPAAGSEGAIQNLRSLGFDDRALLDATLTVAYFSFVNRIVLLLGVPVEKDFAETCGDAAEEPIA